LTYPALDRARAIFFLVLGDDKRNALARLLEHDSTIPAGKVEGEDVVVITDVNDPGEADR
jgi:6-phosphogluconolactonase/glucosamine-6-phosphate isomerase/deaminase